MHQPIFKCVSDYVTSKQTIDEQTHCLNTWLTSQPANQLLSSHVTRFLANWIDHYLHGPPNFSKWHKYLDQAIGRMHVWGNRWRLNFILPSTERLNSSCEGHGRFLITSWKNGRRKFPSRTRILFIRLFWPLKGPLFSFCFIPAVLPGVPKVVIPVGLDTAPSLFLIP